MDCILDLLFSCCLLGGVRVFVGFAVAAVVSMV